MVRGNRKFIVASTLLALPVALLMASLSTGTSPDAIGPPDGHAPVGLIPSRSVETAVTKAGNTAIAESPSAGASGVMLADGSALEADSGLTGQVGAVQQVGLLETIAERRAQSNATKRAPQGSSPKTSQRQSQSSGLLSELFGSGNRPQPTPAAARPVASERPSPNWDGIPYHEPRVASRTKSSVPIRDPSDKPSTRIIRGQSSRTINAAPVSARRETRIILPPPVAKTRVIKPIAVPTPGPASAIPSPSVAGTTASSRRSTATTVNPLSSSNSSRRTGRRSVAVLEPKIISKAATDTPTKSAVASSSQIEEELVPKFSRRPLTPKAVTKTESPKADTEAESSKVATKEVAADRVAESKPSSGKETTPSSTAESTEQPKPRATHADVVAKATEQQAKAPETQVPDSPAAPAQAIAEASKSASTPVPSEPAEVAPKSKLLPPTPTAPVASTGKPYTEPSDVAAVSPAPAANVDQPAYAASMPISHRAGPPATEFQPRQVITTPSIESESPSQNQTAASEPVGSGLLPQLPPASPSADAYISAAPQSRAQGTAQGTGVDTALEALPSYSSTTTPLHTSQPAPASSDPIRTPLETAGPRSALPEAQTRHLKPGETAVASELPGIRVVTHGPGEIMIRQTQQYEIRVENRGSIDAQGVMVRAMIPDWADVRGHNATQGNITPQSKNSKSQDTFNVGTGERLVWTIDHLPAGASERMFIRLRAERSGSHGVDVDWTLVPQKSVTKVHVHEPQLSLVIDGPPEVIFGRSQTYKVRVMNPGDGIAPNVTFTLSPNSATPQTQRIGDIPAGKEAQFEVELTAQDLGDLKIHGLASGDLELRAEASKTIHVAAAKLEAIMNGPELKYQNTEAVYQLQVKNNGNAMTEQVVATLQLPGGAKYLGGIADSLQRGQAIKWTIDALAPGATRDYEFRCNMASTGDQLFAFECKGTAAAETSVSIATRVESIADLVLTINDPVAPAPVSTEVAYEIVVRNRGSREANQVRAIAQFSHGIEPKRLEGHSGDVLTGQVLFDPIPRIAAGEEVRLRIVAEAQRAGHHRFRSEVRSGSTVLVAEEATHFMNPRSDRVSRSSSEQKVMR